MAGGVLACQFCGLHLRRQLHPDQMLLIASHCTTALALPEPGGGWPSTAGPASSSAPPALLHLSPPGTPCGKVATTESVGSGRWEDSRPLINQWRQQVRGHDAID